MADTIISAIIGDLVSRAISILIGRFSNQESTEGMLQRMRYLVIRIRSVVEEAKGRQISNHGTLQWLSELIDVEFQGYYLLDSVECRGGKDEVGRDDDAEKVNSRVSTCLSLFNPAKRVRISAAGCTTRHTSFCCHQHDIGGVDEIERVLQRLQGMCQDLREFILLLQDCKPICRPLPTNIFRDGQMFGRHVEKERIINFLLHEDDQLGVLPIVGGSGVGKTTLVQYACDDARVRSHFPVIMLYSFSSTYDVKKNEDTSSNDPLELVKSNTTFGGEQKRCLLISEDVDMHKKQILEEFIRSPRTRIIAGMIKVIITTNNPRVANIVGTVEPIMLKALPCSEYWFFFKAHAFAGRDVEDDPRQISMGKAIARKLNGSFFGAKIVGGVLRDHPDARHWCEVLRSNIGDMCPLGDGMTYISDLADNLLPGHVNMWKVTLCNKDPSFPPQSAQQLVMLKDVCGAVPHDSMLACWEDNLRFDKVLLCKSVLPFFNNYYIARCSCNCSIG